MSEKTVFISYSHDSSEHSGRVLGLAWALRDHGLDVELDQFHNEEIVDWPRWCNEQTSRENSEFIVCVCTAEYRRRIEGKVPPEKGKGVYWEGSLLDDDLYDDKGNSRLIPLLLDDEPESSIPRFLRGWTHCRSREAALSDSGYEHLIRILTKQSKVEKNPVGAVPVLPTKRAPKGSPSSTGTAFQADISRIIKYAPAELIGREAETQILTDAWVKVQTHDPKRPHVLTFVALGGEGKTSLVAKWAADLAAQDWPGCEAVFAWSFYSQGTREQTAVSSDLFLAEALTFFGDAAMAGSAAGAFDKGRRLAQLVGERRALLILDGLEPLQYAPTSPTPGELKDQGLSALLKGLAATCRGLCVVTTRYALPDLRAFIGKTVREEKLTRLSRAAGVQLLQTFGVKGSLRQDIRSPDGRELWNEFEELVEDVQGHALTLNLLASYLRDAHAGDIRKRDLVKLEEADAEEQGGHAFHVMDAYARAFESEGEKGQRALAFLRLMGLFDRPATADCLNALWQAPVIEGLTDSLVGLAETQRNLVLKRLENAKLLTVNRDAVGALLSLDAHPLIREYFAKRLREGSAGAPPAVSGAPAGNIDPAPGEAANPLMGAARGSGGSSAGARTTAGGGARAPQTSPAWRAAHRRLYEHLCASTEEGDKPTLEDLQPLYQAVAHGCQAGLQQEACDKVYRDRIYRVRQNYAASKLGAFGSEMGAVACFFEPPWSRLSSALSEPAQAWVLAVAAFGLRALGRLTESLALIRAGLAIEVKRKDWVNAARSANNLSELELTLGEVAEAVGDAEQSVTYSDRSGDAFMREVTRATHADALHQAGRRTEAEARFREVGQMQAERQPAYPLLYSVRGFRCCDLLLTEAERAAWQMIGRGGLRPPKESDAHRATLQAVSERAAQTLKIAEQHLGLLDIALDHLTLGRAALCAAILGNFDVRPATLEIDLAVSGLRRAGTQHHLVLGLLTRAWLRSLAGSAGSPQVDSTDSASSPQAGSTGSPQAASDSAQSDLDEAWEIVERGPMPLFLADIHLHRARLFGRRKAKGEGREEEQAYPWESPEKDLAEARRLIFKHGYLRRKEELEDAEAVILRSPM